MYSQKRRRFWIDPPLQLQMLATVMVLVVGSIFLVSYSVFHGLEGASLESRQLFHSLDWVRETVRGPMLISACISVLASAIIALIWSHRFAGPLRVLSAAMARISQGNLSVPVRIRQSDTHQELVHEFARMQESMGERLSAVRRSREATLSKRKEILPNLPEHHEARKELKALIEELESGS